MVFSSPFGSIDIATTPLHVDLLNRIDEAIRRDPTKKAFIDGANPSRFLTYPQLKDQALAISQFLENRGFVKQTACIVLPNCYEFFTFFLGVSIQGGAVSGASALFTDFELERQFKDSRCTTILTDKNNLEKVKKAAHGISAIKSIIVLGVPPLTPGTISWNEVISTPINPNRKPVPINVKEDVVVLPYSSGTTGSPKGVMLTHQNVGTSMRILLKCRRINEIKTTGSAVDWNKENMLLFLPFYHLYGFCMTAYCVLEKSTAVILSKFEPATFLQCLQDYKISQMMCAPPILVFLAKQPMCDKYNLTSLTRILSGAAPAGKDVCDALTKRYPHLKYIEQRYGMTENSAAITWPDDQSSRKFGSCGKLAAGLQMKIIDLSSGAELPVGQAGEICIRGPTIMKGYLGREEATRETIRNEWLHSGDIGYADADGDLFIIDRLKELIKVKGFQVPPAELEDLLLSHPRIQDAAVIGVPHENDGEQPKAYVVRKDLNLTAEEVFKFVADKVVPYKQLKGGIVFIDAIPKSAAGKILRRKLRDMQKSKL